MILGCGSAVGPIPEVIGELPDPAFADASDPDGHEHHVVVDDGATDCLLQASLGAAGSSGVRASIRGASTAYSAVGNVRLQYHFAVYATQEGAPFGLVPVEFLGIAYARAGYDANPNAAAQATVAASGYPGFFPGVRARDDPAGGCDFGEETPDGGCLARELVTGSVLVDTIGSIYVTAVGTYAFEAFADPILRVAPLGEFAPGMRYADYFDVAFSEGVVNAVPEPSSGVLGCVGLTAVFTSAIRRRLLLRSARIALPAGGSSDTWIPRAP